MKDTTNIKEKMSKKPEEAPQRISQVFRVRLLKIIEEQDCDKKEFSLRTGVSKSVITRATVYGNMIFKV